MSRLELGNWDDMRLFIAIARAGSFTAAAFSLKINQATVSRRMEQLEQRLGAKLFDRVEKGVRLTPAATAILDRVQAMENAAVMIERQLAGVDRELQGVVRIAATEGIGAYWLTPRLLAFQRQYPRIEVEVVTGTQVLDLGKREADLAIRLARPTDPRLVALWVGRMRFALYCSQAYSDVYGMPQSLDDLKRHRLADHSGYARLDFWAAIVRDHPFVVYRSNSSVAFLEAVRVGYGIGPFPTYTPKFICTELQEVPVPLEAGLDIWLISHVETRDSAKVRALLSYLRESFDRDRAQWFS